MKLKLFMLAVLAIAILPAFIRIVPPESVSGIVKDEAGNPIENVSVYEKGNKNGVMTDNQGAYKLKLTTKNPVLVFSLVGYELQSIKVGNDSKVNVTLKYSKQELQEVVVVGYSTVKKQVLTGSVTTINSEAISSHQNVNAARMRHTGDSNLYPDRGEDESNTEEYDAINETGFQSPFHNPLSTFSIDVDAASYSNIRRFITQGSTPPYADLFFQI